MTRIARASLIIAVFFTLDKGLGFIRQILFTRSFGLSYQLDAFNAANNIPDMLSALISGGALGMALIPVLSEYLARDGRRAAWDLFSRIVNLAFLVTASIALLVILLAEPLVRWIVPWFPAEQQALTMQLMRLDLVAILIFSISGLVMAGLQANQHFLLPAMAPAFYNLGQIFGVTVLAPQTGLRLGPLALPALGLGVHGLVYGVILGAVLHLATQEPGLLRYQFRWTPAINLHHAGVQQVLLLMGPRFLTVFFVQLYFILRDRLATFFGEGAVTALNVGWFIQQVPETLIGTAISIALLPTLAELVTANQSDDFRQTVNRALRVILALTIPVAALLMVGLPPLVQIAFHLNADDTQRVTWAARAFLLGLMGQAWLEVAVRSFYAQKNALIPLYTGGLNILAFLLLAVTLSRWIGLPGIALADTLAFSSQALLLLYLLNRRYQGVLQVGRTLVRAVPAALAGALLVYLLMRFLPYPPLFVALASLAAGGILVLPFIWPEVKLLIKL